MSTLLAAYHYALEHHTDFTQAVTEHIHLVLVPLALGLVLGLPLGFFSARFKPISPIIIGMVNSLRVIPSLAVLFLAIPWLGLGWNSAILAITLLVLPPIVLNTALGFQSLDPAIQEAAQGMGMPVLTRLWSIEIPLALPWIIAGIKTSLVEAISSATLAAFIGAGGLGTFIVLGFALYDPAILLVGAVPVAFLALITELSLSFLEFNLKES